MKGLSGSTSVFLFLFIYCLGLAVSVINYLILKQEANLEFSGNSKMFE